ncbi:MAG: phosphoserine phosphatase SerB [Hydrogenophilaceae bacterium]|jgi:phosphoserine phosphatase|nr:phosphoserine phosphatase SerB [Hydrogenophilaceae bacterium]
MTYALVFVAADRPSYFEAVRMLGRVALKRKRAPPRVLGPWEAAEWDYDALDSELAAEAGEAVAGLAVDWAIVKAENRRKRLLVADMDSTIITVECLDELADYAGLKAEIAAITERAMRGELVFEDALRERVGKLKGLGLDALARCYEERVRLTPGARTLARTMAAHGARCVLVSGGFTFFTARVAEAAGFHAHFANTLIDDGAALTGGVGAPILGRAAKLETLTREAAALALTPADALAIGDGANDLDMIRAAGLGLAYRAKPIVAAEADAQIAHTTLETALYFQGYAQREFAGG